MPFGFHLTMNTLPSEGLLLRPTTSLPPSLDMAPLIRAPEGLQPSRTTRCSAHTISQSDFHQVIRSSSPRRFVRPYKLGLNPTDLPCSHGFLWLHAGGTNPGSISGHLPYRILSFCLPR